MRVRPLLMPLAFSLSAGSLLFAAAQGPAHKPRRAAVAAGKAQPAYEKEVSPLVANFCVGCHSGTSPASGVLLTGFKTAADYRKSADLWSRVVDNVASRHMPPIGAPQPTPTERARLVSNVRALLKVDCGLPDPGRVTLRRLNREEYNNTIRDLLGVSIRPAADFPADDVGYGFDNIGDVLSISPILMEKYLNAAEKVTQAAILTPESLMKPARFAGTKLEGAGSPREGGSRILASEGEAGIDYAFGEGGEYVLRATAYGQQAGPDPVKMAFRLDGGDVRKVDVKAVESEPGVYEAKVTVPAGMHHVGLAYLNDYYNAADPNPNNRDRNMVVTALEIAPAKPPALPSEAPETHRRLFAPAAGTKDQAAARKILTAFAGRAFRRPATKDEIDRLARYVQEARAHDQSFERGVQLAMQATLVSPSFLFRIERDPNPKNPKAVHAVSDYEIASRLSYFLWSSMPDDALFALAAKGRLNDPNVLTAQALRMLKDPKAYALVQNFGEQWLTLRRLNDVRPDTDRFPDFNENLRASMRTETLLFFQEIMRDDRSVLDFIDGKFTYLNEALAKHYGVQGVSGDKFTRVVLADANRGGVLTQASVLTVTSNPTRTSPVKRGKWVLEQMLGTPPPPPPPNVPQLPDDKREPLTGTLRQRMEQHRKNPACANCHAPMDPIGFGLENFDAVGAWRTRDGDMPVDASGTLPGGKNFNGPAELKAILRSKKDLFVRNLTEKLLTYALGRGLETYDRCHVDAIVKSVEKRDCRFSALVTAIVRSDPFRKRRGDEGIKE